MSEREEMLTAVMLDLARFVQESMNQSQDDFTLVNDGAKDV